MFGWPIPNPITLAPVERVLFSPPYWSSLFEYRKIVDSKIYTDPTRHADATLVNWPHNDYLLTNVIDKPTDMVENALYEARQLSLSLLYWMQTEAPRPGGGNGYPGLYLRPDLMGTKDGFAMSPYYRESRRIRAVYTVKEEHVGTQMLQSVGLTKAAHFRDSVGIGFYRIDLHPTTGGDNYIDVESRPFQIPLGALLPVRMDNLLPACKNIGVTHITNGCYRLHPVEWNIGESAGLLAAFAILRGVPPRAVRDNAILWSDFSALLDNQGVERAWPDDIE